MPPVPYLRVVLTDACPLACPYCSREGLFRSVVGAAIQQQPPQTWAEREEKTEATVMTMQSYLELLADNAEQMLERGPTDANDFCNLAVAGERLRGAAGIADDAVPHAQQILERYDAFLRDYRGDIPTGFTSRLGEALDELANLATAPAHRRAREGPQQLGTCPSRPAPTRGIKEP